MWPFDAINLEVGVLFRDKLTAFMLSDIIDDDPEADICSWTF